MITPETVNINGRDFVIRSDPATKEYDKDSNVDYDEARGKADAMVLLSERGLGAEDFETRYNITSALDEALLHDFVILMQGAGGGDGPSPEISNPQLGMLRVTSYHPNSKPETQYRLYMWGDYKYPSHSTEGQRMRYAKGFASVDDIVHGLFPHPDLEDRVDRRRKQGAHQLLQALVRNENLPKFKTRRIYPPLQ